MSDQDADEKPAKPGDGDFHRIKQATRALVKCCGGVEASAEIANYSKSEAGRWQVATAPVLIPIDAVLALEKECGLALVTSVMASINGRRLAEPEGGGKASVAALIETYVDVIRAATDLLGTGTAVFADQKLTGSETELLHRSVSALRGRIEALDKSLGEARGSGLHVVGGSS